MYKLAINTAPAVSVKKSVAKLPQEPTCGAIRISDQGEGKRWDDTSKEIDKHGLFD